MGMEEIPKQIGATFGHDVLRLGAKAASLIKTGGQVTGVALVDGTVIEAECVVLACDAQSAMALSGVEVGMDFRHCVTLYFVSPVSPVPEGSIVLNGNMRGIANHLALMPHRASNDSLLSVTILGERAQTDEQLADVVKSEMRLWFPGHDVEEWAFLRGYRVINAQMAQPPGFRESLPGNDSGIPGLFFASEFTSNGSIDGAIQSGLECADIIADRIGVGAI